MTKKVLESLWWVATNQSGTNFDLKSLIAPSTEEANPPLSSQSNNTSFGHRTLTFFFPKQSTVMFEQWMLNKLELSGYVVL